MQHRAGPTAGHGAESSAQNSANGLGYAMLRRSVKLLAIIGAQRAERGAAQPHAPFPASRRTPARGRRARIDDPQHLGGRGLLLQCLARLGDQPRVLHRDDRLRREVLQQRDLLVGERPDLVAVAVMIARAARHPCAAARQAACGRRRARRARASGSPCDSRHLPPDRRCGRAFAVAAAARTDASGWRWHRCRSQLGEARRARRASQPRGSRSPS